MALEALTLLLEDPTDDSVEVAVGFLKVCMCTFVTWVLLIIFDPKSRSV